jgi:UDP-glucuronate decarboxylase
MSLNDGRVISNFVIQALKNEPITIFGKGQQTRSFQYVDDLVEALIRLMNSDDSISEPVNLGNPGEYTILELAKQITKMTHSSSTLSYHPLPENDPIQRQPDITLAKEQLNWEPRVNLRTGLEKTIAYFKNELDK